MGIGCHAPQKCVYNEYIAIEHLRETIYKCLVRWFRNILVNVHLQIVGVLGLPTKLLPILSTGGHGVTKFGNTTFITQQVFCRIHL